MDASNLPTPPTGAGLPPGLQPGPGRLPLKRGTVFLSEETKQELRLTGWKDGDPVPPNLAKHIAAARAAIAQEQVEATRKLAEEDPGKAARARLQEIKQRGHTPISSLPPEEQKKIGEYIQRYAEDALREEAIAAAATANPGPDLSRMDPSVAAAFLQAEAARTGQPSQQAAPVAPGVELPPGKVLAGSMGEPSVAAKLDEIQRAAAAWQAAQAPPAAAQPAAPTAPAPAGTPAAPTAAAADTPAAAGGDIPPQCCPWCGRDPNKIAPTLSDEDKIEFFALFLGGERFRKEISLIGDKLKVRFRSLTLVENELIDRQLGLDVKEGRILGDGDWLAALANYRFAASLERIAAAGQISQDIPPLEIAAKNYAADGGTGVPGYHQWLCKEVIRHEPVRRVLALSYRDFQRLVEHLEVAVFDPNFLEGIELPGSWLGRQPRA